MYYTLHIDIIYIHVQGKIETITTLHLFSSCLWNKLLVRGADSHLI